MRACVVGVIQSITLYMFIDRSSITLGSNLVNRYLANTTIRFVALIRTLLLLYRFRS